MKKAGLIVASVLALSACGDADLKGVPEEYICKSAVSAMFGRPISTINAQSNGDTVTLEYVRASDNSEWAVECYLDGDKVMWRSPDGRWRDHPDDEKVYWSVTESTVKGGAADSEGKKNKVKKVVIKEVYGDGTDRTKYFLFDEDGVVEVDSAASYAIGYKTGEQMKGRMDDLDFEAFLDGMRHAAIGDESDGRMTVEEMDAAITAYQQKKFEEMEADMKKAADDNAAAGQAFRDENGAKEGVTTLENGLQYEVLASGEEGAAQPTLEDTVIAHYHGTLIDGTVFDSSVERGEPATFPLSRVIEGWQEALTRMKVGDKWKVVIPPELGYGENGVGDAIGPNATLVFEVELLEVQKGE